MKRYNQGFGKFGPMERADNDGEWIHLDDVCEYGQAWKDCCDQFMEQSYKQKLAKLFWQQMAYGFAIIDFILLGVLVIVK